MSKRETIFFGSIMFIALMVFNFLLSYDHGYRNGQRDALNGTFKFRLEHKVSSTLIKLP